MNEPDVDLDALARETVKELLLDADDNYGVWEIWIPQAESIISAALASAVEPRVCPFGAGQPTGWWQCSCGAEHQTPAPKEQS